MQPSETTARLDLALTIAHEAGKRTLSFFQQPDLQVDRKTDDSPVTKADREAEELLRDRIGRAFSDDGILGEEFGGTEGSSSYRWILDPIDGTKSFISGVPLYSVLIGILHQDDSVAGVILNPGLDECVYAARGQGAWWQRGGGEALRARVSTRPLCRGVFVSSQVDSFAPRGDAFRQLQQAAYITRTWGDAYGYMLVATGRAEVMVDPIMNVWDAAPLQPILEEAGGSFTDWQGAPTVHAGEGVGCNQRVLDDVLAITRASPKPA